MVKKLGVALLIGLFALVSGGFAGRDGITKRVKFGKGKSSAAFSNAVIRGERDTYILGAKAGQKITVRITSLESNAVFQVENPDGRYVEGAGEEDDATSVTVSLPDSGDYKIYCRGHTRQCVISPYCLDKINTIATNAARPAKGV